MEFDIIIRKLDCIPLMDDLTNVITNVHWSLIGKLDGRQHQININTHLSNDELNISNFTEYKDITLDMMVEWIRKESGENGMDNYKNFIIKYFEENKNIPTINPNLPWNQV